MVTLSSVLMALGLDPLLFKSRAALELHSLSPLPQAKTGQLSFLASAKFRRQLELTQASVVLVAEKDAHLCPASTVALVVDDPYQAYAIVSQLFDLTPSVALGVHPSAVVDDQSIVDPSACIGPNAVIGRYAVIAAGAQIGANATIEEGAQVGIGSRIGANVVINHRCVVGDACLIQNGTVIGSNGFGYAPTQTGWSAIAQVGRVLIGDRVEIGANCTIDRGAIEDTVIEDDVIIDNLVHVAHNVTVGKRTALAGQVGIAGSTKIGAGCSFGGQSGLAGHITIADNSHFTGQAMVTKGTTDGGLYSSGIPAQPNREWRKMVARIRQLETIIERISILENAAKKEEIE